MSLPVVCLVISLVIVAVQCQVLNFKMQLTTDSIYCGHLRCVANSSQAIIGVEIYNVTEKGTSVKLASISVYAPEATVDSSKASVVNASGTISKSDGVLDVSFSREVGCLYRAYQCELDFVNSNGQPDLIREDLAPASEDNADILNSLAQISTQLKDTNTQLEGLKHDTEVLKQDNEVVKTVMGSVLGELSSIKELLNSTLDNDQQHRSFCYRGMPHESPREKFVLQGKILALCDTETDGGGWVILQRRVRGDEDFYKGWADYKKGFGTTDTDFWIGNDIIHDLTQQGYNELRIDFVHAETKYFAQYTNFNLGDESSQYLITVGGFSGNVYDSMNYHNGNKFSTFDRDNDVSGSNCAVQYHGAWWYNQCYDANLNGAYVVTGEIGISWRSTVNDYLTNLLFTEIKVRHV